MPRYSTDQDDPGFLPYLKAMSRGRVLVTLDGQPIDDVLMADEERGELTRWMKGEDGSVLIDEAAGEVRRETLKGRVCVLLQQ